LKFRNEESSNVIVESFFTLREILTGKDLLAVDDEESK
jgi:hypothetical protein